MISKSKYLFYFLCAILLISIITIGCDDNSTCGESNTTQELDKMNWSDKNYEVLNQIISDYGKNGKFYQAEKPPYVVFDWDQTCAHLDVEEAVMRYQLTNLRFKITKEQFVVLLKAEINGITQLSADYNNIVLSDINDDLISDYSYIYDNYSGLTGTMSLEEIQKTLQYKDFRAKLPYLYAGYCGTPGIGTEYSYDWIIYMLAGYTIEEVKAIAKETISYEIGNQLSMQSWISPADFQTKSGSLSYSYKTGLRVFPEMQNLISTCKANGIDVFIVSASFKPLVEVFSGIGNYGYNVPSDRVIAMETGIGSDGKILPEYKTGWVKPLRQGKVDAINTVIKQGLGKNWDPLFSAGESDSDYEMCTMFPNMKLSLIWNRLKGGDIGKLCTQAVAEKDNPNPRYILQGRNENTGMVIPMSESILFGKTEPELLP